MIQRIWKTVTQYLESGAENHTAVDACIDCGKPSLPGTGRCTDCLDN